jgi:hypothetical protein
MKRIFALATAFGEQVIVRKLIAEGVPAFGRTKRWARSYVAKLLSDRRVLGELQPKRKDGTPEGEVIKGYFPVVVSPEEFYAAREGMAQRQNKRGRLGKHVNVFSGLLRSASDGEGYTCAWTFGSATPDGQKRKWRVLKNHAGMQGRARSHTFPLVTFERAIFSRLREIDPHAILNGEGGPDESQALAGELSALEARIATLEEIQAETPSKANGRALAELEGRQEELAGRLAEARQRAAHPLSESWGQAHGLLDALDNAADPDDARLRLRAVLRRLVDRVWLLVVPRGQDRLCACQVWFKRDRGEVCCRSYLILHRPPKANASARVDGGFWVKSFAEVAREGDFDLRNRDDARRLEAVLSQIDTAKLSD